MPKDEFDFEDPMELSGVALCTGEDTSGEMAECFIEEFMRMGYPPARVLALFRNPGYLGPNLVLRRHGESFVRARIGEVFARWGQPVTWPAPAGNSAVEASLPAPTGDGPDAAETAVTSGLDTTATDPMGAALPRLPL